MKQASNSVDLRPLCWLAVAVAASALLAACGGGAASDAVGTQAALTGEAGAASEAHLTTVPAAFARNAALSSADLAAADQLAQAAEMATSPVALDELQAGQIAAKSAYSSGAVARKAAAVRIPVYRFFNGSTGAHFFTTSTAERDNVVNTLSPPFSLEGEAFSVASAFSPGLSPVHRFYNTQSGVHFYTISETERANVVATFPQFNYEGVAYHASQVAGAGLIPFYRFFVPSKGFHFYTANGAEKDNIIANLAATYTYEGIGYYVLDSNWRAEKLPHSGVTVSQCFEANSNTLVACNSVSARNLHPQQDGHRVAINPMSYSELPNPAGGNFSRSNCVIDDVTGLVWEGKNPTGERSGANTYTNYGDGTMGDASAYVNRINQLALCGFTDWRLPTQKELMGIVDYGRTVAPTINITWFPNTAAAKYWTVESLRNLSANAWYGDFQRGISEFGSRTNLFSVRLVRGNFTSGPRYSYSTVAYGSDGANNAVNDAWTGLQWRRCEQGRVWSGNACTGTVFNFHHELAFAYTWAQSGWRIPNIKELNSLVDLSASSGANIDSVAFPGANSVAVWSSSPLLSNVGSASSAGGAKVVLFADGNVTSFSRGAGSVAVRLVRAIQ